MHILTNKTTESRTNTSNIVMSTEYIVVVLPLGRDQVRLREHQAHGHQVEKDWGDYARKCGDRVWYEAPGERSKVRKSFWFIGNPLLSRL